jgi:hypothetical protein
LSATPETIQLRLRISWIFKRTFLPISFFQTLPHFINTLSAATITIPDGCVYGDSYFISLAVNINFGNAASDIFS